MKSMIKSRVDALLQNYGIYCRQHASRQPLSKVVYYLYFEAHFWTSRVNLLSSWFCAVVVVDDEAGAQRLSIYDVPLNAMTQM